jgi:hypothetical protein
VNVVVEVAASSNHFERVATLYVDLGTMCNTSSKGWVEASPDATSSTRPPTHYKVEVLLVDLSSYVYQLHY